MSKIKVEIRSMDKRVPRSDLEFIMSYKKQLILTIGEEFFKETYYWNGKANKKVKDINSAIYYHNFQIDGEFLRVEKFSICISCYSEELLEKLAVAALKNKEFVYKDMEFRCEGVEFVEKREIKESYALFKTMSPIVVKNKEGKYIDVDDAEYQECLNHTTNVNLESIRGSGLREKIKMIPINMKKIVLKERLNNFSTEDYYYINAFKGSFLLRGDRQDLNAIHQIGLGTRRSEGKGCITLE